MRFALHHVTTQGREWESGMHVHTRTNTVNYGINWRGVAGLAAMALGSALGWIAIVTGFRSVLR